MSCCLYRVVLEERPSVRVLMCNADIVLLLILAPFSVFSDFLFGIELHILAVYVHQFVGVVGYYLQFEMGAVL